MTQALNRREMLLASGAAWLGAGSLARGLGAVQGNAKKVLFFTKSSGFPHPVVTAERSAGACRANPDRGGQGARVSRSSPPRTAASSSPTRSASGMPLRSTRRAT